MLLSLEHIRAQLDLSELLLLSVVNLTHLRDLLRLIQVELTSRLPADPVKELWYYHKSLRCTTFIGEDKIVSLPLLDGENDFKMFQVVNLPVQVRKEKGEQW